MYKLSTTESKELKRKVFEEAKGNYLEAFKRLIKILIENARSKGFRYVLIPWYVPSYNAVVYPEGGIRTFVFSNNMYINDYASYLILDLEQDKVLFRENLKDITTEVSSITNLLENTERTVKNIAKIVRELRRERLAKSKKTVTEVKVEKVEETVKEDILKEILYAFSTSVTDVINGNVKVENLPCKVVFEFSKHVKIEKIFTKCKDELVSIVNGFTTDIMNRFGIDRERAKEITIQTIKGIDIYVLEITKIFEKLLKT